MNVKVKMVNCTCDLLTPDKKTGTDGDYDVYTISSVSSLTFKANSGFHFLNKVGGGNYYEDFELIIQEINNFDYPSSSFTLSDANNYTKFRMVAFKDSINKLTDYQADLQGCTCEDINDNTLLYINEFDHKIYGVNSSATEFSFVPIEGLQFIEGVIGTGELSAGGTTEFKITDGNYQLFVLSEPLNYDAITITGTKQAEAIINTNIFVVNDDILSKLYRERFIDIKDSAGNITKDDLGVYILNLYAVYLPISDDQLTDEINIPLGYYKTDVKAPTLKKTHFTFDLGSITISSKYNNVFDFKDTDIIIKLPFISEFVNIEPCYAINQTLQFIYDVDFYTGSANIIIKSSFNNGIVTIINKKISGDIPYILLNSVNTDYNQVQQTIQQVEIDVIRNKPIIINANTFGKDSQIYSRIGDLTGYIVIDNILFKSDTANEDEKTQIVDLLKSGVFINA